MIDYGVCMGMLKGVRSQLYTIWTRHGPYKPVAGLEVESHFKYAKKKKSELIMTLQHVKMILVHQSHQVENYSRGGG